MLDINACSKVCPQNGQNEQQAMMYLKLRQAGCRQRAARKFCSRNFCRLDQTTKKVGPKECKIITPITRASFGVHGWQPNLTIKYDLGEQFILAKDLGEKENDFDLAVQKKYNSMQKVYESAFKDQINEIQHYIEVSQGKAVLPQGLSRKQLLKKLQSLTSDLKRQNNSPTKFFKHRGQKYHYIVEDVIKDYLDNFGTIMKEEQYDPDTQKLARQQSEDERLLNVQQCWTPSRRNPRIRKSIFSKQNQSQQSQPDFIIAAQDADPFYLNRQFQNSQVHSMKQIRSSFSLPKSNLFEKSIEENKFTPISMNLENVLSPFQPRYNLDPKKILIQHDEKPRRQVEVNNEFISYQKSLKQMNAESAQIINLLEQNGISDSLDAQTNKSQIEIKMKGLSILAKSQSQPAQQQSRIIRQGTKSKMARDFNQTQYLFKSTGYKPAKDLQLVLRNIQRNGENINNISLIKPIVTNKVSRRLSIQSQSKGQSVNSMMNSVIDIDNQPSRSQKGSFYKTDNQSCQSFSQISSVKVDFSIQLKKLIHDTVLKMNQKGAPIQVDDSQLKIQRDIQQALRTDKSNHQIKQRTQFYPQLIKSFIKKFQ